MNFSEKQEKLNLVFNTLKNEFVGLDNILDELKLSISPWYLTPEILNRPVVISLWGMTGTGKTSVIKRLIKLLDLENKSLFFDCGLEAGDGNSSGFNNISDNIANKIGAEDYEGDISSNFSDMIFVFDEFQYARTINEVGEELLKSPLRPIWDIIDDGCINIDESKYELLKIINFIDDFSLFMKRVEIDPEISNGEFVNKKEFDIVKNSIELRKYYKNSISPNFDFENEENKKEEDDTFLRISFFDEYYFSFFIKKLNTVGKDIKLGYEFINKFIKFTKSSEVINLFNSYKKYITKPKILECKKSLVFILGNLDEAFGVEKELNPDYDADVFKNITENVTISDIKEALKKRFRAEQIARFGNNLIKYPTLGSSDFIKIIKKETNRILDEFYKISKVRINIGEDIISLLYSEGVYPVQGVRPVLTTIGSIFTPLLSDIILNKESIDSESTIKLNNINDWKVNFFKIPEITVDIEFNNSKKVINKKIKLQLGAIRDPKSKKTRYITSVHESGHAIISMYLNGEYPVSIVSVSTDDGGFCDTHIKENVKKIDSKEDIDNEVMICLGGYKAEELVYGKNNKKCLMGSSSDLYEAWKILSYSVYNCGYLNLIRYTCYDTESMTNIPSGLNSKEDNVDFEVKKLMKEFEQKVENFLNNEKRLLKEMSIYLGEHGSLPIDILKTMVSKYGNVLTPEYMKNRKYEMSEEYYYNELINLTE